MNESTTVLAKTQQERNEEEAARKALMGGEEWEDPEDPQANTHGSTRLEDTPFDEEDEDFEKPRKVYENNEKEKWIYGTPGTEDYKTDLTDDEIEELEIMWDYDFALSIVRGVI